ncbi:sensor histidine kinase [Tengunoibacter tsumagoiensis]|uniref:Circadian input-output histidine kinase CikA n=1 Tax=Tengunoibacter tsumagoiensis TaxID=2014871 RepID=A0A402A2J2_9CHLR|nr:HAMP domain-containing sensor histidine kinase [Tengunoibacter tsumagoiensis]GCE13276.1 hypothetical protein KTT_31350 [Tengunoibacter tsumagoiensis]
MRFTVRSLGGKLTTIVSLTLLLCLLLFIVLVWSLFLLTSENQARNDAQVHLKLLQSEYQVETTFLIHQLEQTAHEQALASSLSQPLSMEGSLQMQQALLAPMLHQHFSHLEVLTKNNQRISIGAAHAQSDLTAQLIAQALQGQTVTAIQPIPEPMLPAQPAKNWEMVLTIPLQDQDQTIQGVLLATQPIDTNFVQTLLQPMPRGFHILLCQNTTLLTSSDSAMRLEDSSTLCTASTPRTVQHPQPSLLLSARTHCQQQMPNSPTMTLTVIEPLYTLATHSTTFPLLMLGIGLFVFALGVMLSLLIIRILVIRPLQQLQSQAQALVVEHITEETPFPPKRDELSTLQSAIQLLAQSIHHENIAQTEQMSHLLIMSDALMSTLNLEQLLGEFVARMGNIMKVKHVSLLLYGREMPLPWAVAQWSDSPALPSLLTQTDQNGVVTVHIDPDGDITMVVTSKLAAIPNGRIQGAEKRTNKHTFNEAGRSPEMERIPHFPTGGGLRIPPHALRDLDRLLGRMAIQRKKIVYGEDIAMIYQVRKEHWASLALEEGYRSAISVPLLFQDQAIGAFILYLDQPHQISKEDTFLLSTAALQTSMAIENALLFAEVKEKNAALERANQLKSQFLANVTHELRSPLHSIISYGALLVDGFVDGKLTTEQEEHIQFMVRRAEDLSHLVDDMLDLSKIEADRIEVKPEPLELPHYLRDIVNQLKPLANNKELALHLEITEPLPLALADSYRLRQVAINLISNALKFTEKGGVTIRCIPLQKPAMLRISVQDTGIGISPAALSYIFEAFRQADGSTTRRFGGTGLGLTIAKRLIELQGGEIAVESVPGEGSTFSFTIPTVQS